MSDKNNNSNENNNKEKEEIKEDAPKIFIYEEVTNDDSKSLILAPYNSYISQNDNEEEEKEELDILNEACDFESLAQEANIEYEKKNQY